MYEYAVKKVVYVVDGDTVDIEIDLGFSLTKKERVRLAGIDTPESRTRNLEEKELGLRAKDYLKQMLKDSKNLKVQTSKDGKYGRMLGWFFENDLNINLDMVENGHAWAYDGGTKIKNLQDLISIQEQSNEST